MGNEQILAADLGREWLKDADFRAEYDALAEEFALATVQMTAGTCGFEWSENPQSEEYEMPRGLGMTHGIC
jgi:hypothetical protein